MAYGTDIVYYRPRPSGGGEVWRVTEVHHQHENEVDGSGVVAVVVVVFYLA